MSPQQAAQELANCLHCGLLLARRARRAPRARGAAPFCCTGCHVAWELRDESGDGRGDRFLARIVLSALFGLGVMACSLAHYSTYLEGGNAQELASAAAKQLRELYQYGALFFSVPVVFLLVVPLVQAIVAARNWFGTDAFVLLGSMAAYVLSLRNTFVGAGPVYYETATMVIVLVAVGRWLDAGVKQRAQAHLSKLVTSWVGDVRRVDEHGAESRVEPEQLALGDLVRCGPGDFVPTRGIVRAGVAFVDRAVLTGEAEPFRLEPDAQVEAGSCVLDGTLEIETLDAGGAEARAEWHRLLVGILMRQGSYLRLADRAAAALFPIVASLALAALVFHARRAGLTAGVMTALSVVLVSCPCALGIATPLVFWSALGSAWKRGIVAKDSDSLERLARARRIVFDKTGTLTDGHVELRAITLRGELDELEVLRIAAAVEAHSEHPLGRSLHEEWRRRDAGELPQVRDFRVEPGWGVRAELDGACYRVGRSASASASTLTTIQLEREGQLLAEFSLAGRLRPEAERVVAELKQLGLELAVLTGDRAGPAELLERQLHVNVHADLLPRDKLAWIEAAGARGTIFVGDGLNDVEALAAADVGIAVAGSPGRSLRVANIGLVEHGLEHLPWLLRLAREAFSRARWNLFWALAYNSVGLVYAMSGKLNPLLAAGAMVVSSLVVVWNAKRPYDAAGAAGATPSDAGSRAPAHVSAG